MNRICRHETGRILNVSARTNNGIRTVVATAAGDWFEEIEQLCADALQDPDFDLGTFDAALVASADKLAGVDLLQAAPAFPGNSSQWHWPTASVNAFAAAVSAPLMNILRPLTT